MSSTGWGDRESKGEVIPFSQADALRREMLQPRKMFSKVCDSDSAHVILVAISSAFFPETQTPVPTSSGSLG